MFFTNINDFLGEKKMKNNNQTLNDISFYYTRMAIFHLAPYFLRVRKLSVSGNFSSS